MGLETLAWTALRVVATWDATGRGAAAGGMDFGGGAATAVERGTGSVGLEALGWTALRAVATWGARGRAAGSAGFFG